jgi:hypothetical protein
VPTFRRRSFARLALAGALLLGLTAAAPTVSAQGDPAFTPYCIDGLEIQAEPGQDLLVVCGWGATTKGLLQMFIKADATNFVLTDASGNVVWSLGQKESAAYWGKPYSLADSDQGVDCKEDTFWAADWQYTLPGLSAGTYTLTTTDAYRHPINDGYHTCSFDGEPISPTPSLYRTGVTTSVVTIVVAAQ